MKHLAHHLPLCAAIFFLGCSITKHLPDTLGDPRNAPNYGYTPIDPLPAYIDDSTHLIMNFNGDAKYAKLLSEETMRMAIASTDDSAGISYATNKVGTAGHSYIVVLDYIKYVSLPMFANVIDSANIKTIKNPYFAQSTITPAVTEHQTIMPLYVGVGLRITANITVRSGSVSLSNLFGIGASASLSQTAGTLTVQTLGITGDGISALIPIPSELNATTIQNAILSLGSIKAKIYEPSTVLSPRVVGFYNNVGGNGASITNTLISNVFSKAVLVKTYILPEKMR
jgi:hypothetical protein